LLCNITGNLIKRMGLIAAIFFWCDDTVKCNQLKSLNKLEESFSLRHRISPVLANAGKSYTPPQQAAYDDRAAPHEPLA